MNYFILIIYFLLPFSHLHANVDLENMAQEFVLETKHIHIPGYPNAFNTSMVRWGDHILMSFRDIPYPILNIFNSRLGLIILDKDFNPVGKAQILDNESMFDLIPSRAEDGRLVYIGDRLYLVYSDCKTKLASRGGFRVYITEIVCNKGYFFAKNVECLAYFENEGQHRREKNWTPFDYKGDMLLSYSLHPHLVFRAIIGTSTCETVSLTKGNIDWDWGDLRGGTPGMLIDGQYLSFFHSSKNMSTLHSHDKEIAHYFMGAYTFSPEPPFEITGLSPEPIVGINFYKGKEYKPYWKPVKVVFPCGYIFDEKYIWITYGRDDHETWVVKLDKVGLLNSLVPITKEK